MCKLGLGFSFTSRGRHIVRHVDEGAIKVRGMICEFHTFEDDKISFFLFLFSLDSMWVIVNCAEQAVDLC